MKRRDQIKLTLAEQEEFLSKAPKAALATLDKDGYPHVVAMNYLWQDGAILMTSYGKAQKVLNARRDPRVGVMVETGRAYADLRGVLIRGECEIVEDVATVNATMHAIRNRYSGGGGGAENTALTTAPKRVVMKVIPRKITSWDHSKLAGVY